MNYVCIRLGPVIAQCPDCLHAEFLDTTRRGAPTSYTCRNCGAHSARSDLLRQMHDRISKGGVLTLNKIQG